MKAIRNGNAILPDSEGKFFISNNMDILFDDKIRDIAPTGKLPIEEICDEIIDAQGLYVSPGFINIHVHGCMGCDTMDEDSEALKIMAEGQASMGVTAFLPTTMTYDMPRIYRALDRIRRTMGENHGAMILGAHMEGPFISQAMKGAQKASNIRKADFALIEKYADVIRIITIAPEELPDGSDFVERCREKGIIVSMGHTSADYDQASEAISMGVSHATHLYNAMTGCSHRAPGAVGAALDSDIYTELICDNIHVHPAMQRLTHRMKGAVRLILITDSIRACGLGDGESELGGQKVFVHGDEARLQDGTIAGSVLLMNHAVKNFRENTHISIAEAVSFATAVPAKELGLYGGMGSLEKNKLANIVIFDEDFDIKKVILSHS